MRTLLNIFREKTANSWEGSWNRVKNTWTDIVQNIANSDAVITGINKFNNLLSVINKVTDKLGSIGTIGLGAGLITGIKNIGNFVQVYKFKSVNCFEYALHA